MIEALHGRRINSPVTETCKLPYEHFGHYHETGNCQTSKISVFALDLIVLNIIGKLIITFQSIACDTFEFKPLGGDACFSR